MDHDNDDAGPRGRRAALIEHVAEGRVIRESLADGALWQRGPHAATEAIRVERRQVKRSRSPLIAAAISSPVIGPRPTPAPSWPVATHRPASRERPMAGSPSGSHGRRPAHASVDRSDRDRGHQPRRLAPAAAR